MQVGWDPIGAGTGAGIMAAPTGSTMFCSSCGPSGMRSGFSSNGGRDVDAGDCIAGSAMRIVRVMCELAAMVAKVAGDDMAADDRALPAEAPRALAR